MSQGTSAAVHTFCDRQKPIPDGAGQYYVAGEFLSSIKIIKWAHLHCKLLTVNDVDE